LVSPFVTKVYVLEEEDHHI